MPVSKSIFNKNKEFLAWVIFILVTFFYKFYLY